MHKIQYHSHIHSSRGSVFSPAPESRSGTCVEWESWIDYCHDVIYSRTKLKVWRFEAVETQRLGRWPPCVLWCFFSGLAMNTKGTKGCRLLWKTMASLTQTNGSRHLQGSAPLQYQVTRINFNTPETRADIFKLQCRSPIPQINSEHLREGGPEGPGSPLPKTVAGNVKNVIGWRGGAERGFLAAYSDCIHVIRTEGARVLTPDLTGKYMKVVFIFFDARWRTVRVSPGKRGFNAKKNRFSPSLLKTKTGSSKTLKSIQPK